MPGNDVSVRPARREDCPAILNIYNDEVMRSAASYEEEPGTLEDRERWLEAHRCDGYPVLVAEVEGRVVGWSALHRFGVRSGFRFTAEDSVYVDRSARGRGVGGRLLAPLLTAAAVRGLHAVIAAIDSENLASVRLHQRHGFLEVGRFPEVGHKFGRWRDVVYLQYRVPAPAPAEPREA